MECTARVTRERKELGRYPGEPSRTLVEIYCPIMGSVVLARDQAEKATQNLRERDENARAA